VYRSAVITVAWIVLVVMTALAIVQVNLRHDK
jgi:hypothetical protein